MPAPSHRQSHTPFWYAWMNMKARCFNKKNKDYPRWGGRGITVCKEWLLFDNFYKDMFSTYKEGLSLDRKENNKSYCKENCRWVTKDVQANNTRTNHFICFRGENLTISQWSEKTGIKPSTIRMRLSAYKWPIEKTLTTI